MAAPSTSTATAEQHGRIFTVGHSNHDAQVFFALLARHGIRELVDVRSIPSSGRFPQYKKRALETQCARHGVSYRHCPELGNKVDGIGQLLRRPEGKRALEELAASAQRAAAAAAAPGCSPLSAAATAYMCAEADWRDCHRQVIAQELLERFAVATMHIHPKGHVEIHPRDHVLPLHYGVQSLMLDAVDSCNSEGDDAEKNLGGAVQQAILVPATPTAEVSESVTKAQADAPVTRPRRWGKKSAT
eukprot:TRINITY_DN13203_c0_g1_i1.p1 TRINITY_DN13203_c0_g1~~TRINITY_DN13203_c0_g1_i1.p1  ORF type:complete len:259 (-),score=48.49 TRINITY_DN13203_c0_g1_i1:278-1012(-)